MSEQKGNAGVVLGSAGFIAAALALIKVRQVSGETLPPAGELGLDEATMNLLIAIAQTNQNIDENTYKLLLAVAKLSGGNGIVDFENPADFTAFTVLPIALRTAQQLPPRSIPYNHALVIKAYHTNMGVMYVAHNAADAININSSYPLIANEAVELKVKNSDRLWISCSQLGDMVVCIVEQEQV